MCKSGAWTYKVIFLGCLCCSFLLIGAQEDPITHPVEVKALQAIKESLVDPYNNLRNWREDPCVSNWRGVICYNATLNDGYLHVQELQLLNMNLSGSLSPELGRLSHLKILDVMWNEIGGSIPKEIGNITSLELLLLNGNQLTGSLPEELGYLSYLNRLQIDQNQISGPIPKTFANLYNAEHFHMNNNSISGQIPPELSNLPSLVHLLLDNNNMSGYLPSELSIMPRLHILQLDNNQFDGTIPASYSNMSELLKLSLRNCSLRGPIPDLSKIPELYYLDLSSNELTGPIPQDRFSEVITTIDLSNNKLNGTIPVNFAGLPQLQKLSLANNSLTGSVPAGIWLNRTLTEDESLLLDLRNNKLLNVSDHQNPSPNITVWLDGNPVCLSTNMVQFCGNQSADVDNPQNSPNMTCQPQSCPSPFMYSTTSPVSCFCAAPLLIGYRLKSPGFFDFRPYRGAFIEHLSSNLSLHSYQLEIDSFMWTKGPRLQMYLKIFPVYNARSNDSNIFNRSEVLRIRKLFTRWDFAESELFGPYELLNFTLLAPYKDVIPPTSTSSLSKGAVAGIVLGAIAVAVSLSAVVFLLVLRGRMKDYRALSRRRPSSKSSIKIEGVRAFTYGEMSSATKKFDDSSRVGQGGYGNVYRGILSDGTVVAVKRAQEGSLQGEREFLTEIQLLSRLHHRNLVSLIGYCDEAGEQMLVYEFMSHGTLREHLSAKTKEPLNFAMRLRIALASAKGILYLHTEADPPIFHRDVKSSNILLDSKFTAKVADFGLSRLAPVPDMEGVIPAHISTVVKGTPGYLDPEYFATHKLTDKSDVYSLGVVFLEILTGRHPISRGKNIVREVKVAYHSGNVFTIIDERMGSYPSDCVEKFVTLALGCCQDEPDARPSMAEVVRELESIWLLMADSDINTTESTLIGPAEFVRPPSSTMTNPYLSVDVSGSNLDSGVTPSITPR